MAEYEKMVRAMRNRGPRDALRLHFSSFVYSNVPAGTESLFCVRAAESKYKFWERIGVWFLKKAGYELVWPKGSDNG